MTAGDFDRGCEDLLASVVAAATLVLRGDFEGCFSARSVASSGVCRAALVIAPAVLTGFLSVGSDELTAAPFIRARTTPPFS